MIQYFQNDNFQNNIFKQSLTVKYFLSENLFKQRKNIRLFYTFYNKKDQRN